MTRGWRALGYKIIDTEIRGIKYRLNIENCFTDVKSLISSRMPDSREINALKQTTADAAFVDIGANTGHYSLALAHGGCPKVIAIEPSPVTAAALSYNIKINNYEDRIIVSPFCVGDSRGKTPFYLGGDWGAASAVFNSSKVEPIYVETMPLLDILRQASVHAIGGIKIDVEGYEDRVLIPFFDSAPKALYPKTVVMEVLHKHQWENDPIEKMLSIGYKVAGDKQRANLILTLSDK